MPNAANKPAPVSAPVIRAMSEVVREKLIAPVSRLGGIASATTAPRSPMSEGRTSPDTAARIRTTKGLSTPAKASAISIAATIA